MGDVSETKSALFFGSRAMKITNTAYVNVEVRLNSIIPKFCLIWSMANSLFRFRACPNLREGPPLGYLIRVGRAVIIQRRGKALLTFSLYLIPVRATHSQASRDTHSLMGLVSLSLHNFPSPCATTPSFHRPAFAFSFSFSVENIPRYSSILFHETYFLGWLQEAQRGLVQDCWYERYFLLDTSF